MSIISTILFLIFLYILYRFSRVIFFIYLLYILDFLSWKSAFYLAIFYISFWILLLILVALHDRDAVYVFKFSDIKKDSFIKNKKKATSDSIIYKDKDFHSYSGDTLRKKDSTNDVIRRVARRVVSRDGVTRWVARMEHIHGYGKRKPRLPNYKIRKKWKKKEKGGSMPPSSSS